MSVNHHIWYNRQVQNIFTPEEVKSLLRKSDWLAAWEILQVWFWIAGAFALVWIYPSVFTVIPALWILGGKQLGCAIILHDAGHQSLFRNKRWNTVWGNIFGAWPVFHNVEQYRPYHLEHHKTTGTQDDPDLFLTRGYPASRKNMVRKFLRDLTGITGIKSWIGLLAMHLGFLEYNLGNKIVRHRHVPFRRVVSNAWKNLAGPVMANLVMAGIFYAAGNPWLYLMWPAANLLTYPFCIRVRSMAEHSMVPEKTDPHRNTRTVHANFFEKIFFAPLHVNYHVEHHLHMAVPSYHFARMHRMLKERGFYDTALYARGYAEILKMAVKEKND